MFHVSHFILFTLMVANFKKKQKGDLLIRFLLTLGGILILSIVVLLVVANFRIYQKRESLISRIENLKNKIEDIKNENSNLKESISKADDNEYTEKIAREELDLQKPGEKVFSFVMAQNQELQNNKDQKNIFQVWLGWIRGLFKN